MISMAIVMIEIAKFERCEVYDGVDGTFFSMSIYLVEGNLTSIAIF